MQPDRVFISYSRADSKFAFTLAEDLQKAGLNIWIDQSGLRPSEPWDKGIENALEASKYLLVILSPSSIVSSNVLNEINYAIEENKAVLPVVISSNIKKPLNIRRLQHIDFTGSYHQGFNQLLQALDLEKQTIAKRRFPHQSMLWIAALLAVSILAIVLIKTGSPKNTTDSSPEKSKESTLTVGTNVIIGSRNKRIDEQNNASFAKKILEFGNKGIGPGLFTNAFYISVDGKGQIYVGELEGNRVQQFDANGKFLKQWSIEAKGVNVHGIASDRKGNVYAIHVDGVYKYERETGKCLGKVLEGHFYSDIKTAADDDLVVADGIHDNITRINPEGKIVQTIHGVISSQTGQVNTGTHIAIDGMKNIYALDYAGHSIFKFSAAGKFVTQFGSKGEAPGQFIYPHGLAVDGYGRVYVIDIRSIKVFDATGRFLTSFNVDLCNGMAFNDSNELLVVTGDQVIKFKTSEKLD